MRKESDETAAMPFAPPVAPVGPQSPDERIEEALTELRESVAQDLLERIAQAPPAFFEQLVLDLLHAMGYGTSRDDLRRVGGSGDGGIDGIISLDRLGLEKVYVQAKRWKNKVGSPEIQGFLGALQLRAHGRASSLQRAASRTTPSMRRHARVAPSCSSTAHDSRS